MADSLTVWEYTGGDNVSLTWTRDGKIVTVQDTDGNSYTYTIDDAQHFTEMTLVKDGATVEWPENTAYTIKGSDKVTLSGTIVTATTKMIPTKLITRITANGVTTDTIVAEGTLSDEYGLNIIAVGVDEHPIMVFGCGSGNTIDDITPAYDTIDVYSNDFDVDGVYIDVDGVETKVASNFGETWTDIRPFTGVNTNYDIIVYGSAFSSTFTLYHDTTD